MSEESDNRFFELYVKNPEKVNHDELDRRFYMSFARSVLIALIEDGEITEDDLDSGAANSKFEDAVLPLLLGEVEHLVVTEHRNIILSEARSAAREQKIEMARMLYALYFEHDINQLVSALIVRSKISEESRKQMLFFDSRHKLTWMMEVLNVNPPNPEFLKFIKKLSDGRNEFVHYKWTGSPLGSEETDVDFVEIERFVRYFKLFSGRCLYRGRKKIVNNKIDKFIEKRRAH